jgi:hypothetical protein
MFRIRDLAVQAIAATSDDPEGNMLGFGPIYKLLDARVLATRIWKIH